MTITNSPRSSCSRRIDIDHLFRGKRAIGTALIWREAQEGKRRGGREGGDIQIATPSRDSRVSTDTLSESVYRVKGKTVRATKIPGGPQGGKQPVRWAKKPQSGVTGGNSHLVYNHHEHEAGPPSRTRGQRTAHAFTLWHTTQETDGHAVGNRNTR